MNNSIKAYIFDLDGTLVDAYQAVAATLNYALKQLGFPPADEEIIKRRVGWGQRYLIEAFVPESDVDKVQPIYRNYHRQALKTGTKFLPGAKELLTALKEKGYQLAVATNRPRYSSEIILKYLKMRDYFDVILCGDELDHLKPHPEILRRILKKLKLTPEQAIYVGDMTLDVETGNAAGVKTIAVTTGSSTEEEIAALDPYKIVHNVLDIVMRGQSN